MAPSDAWCRKRVAAISCFGQRVGAKAKAHIGFGDLVDDFYVGPFIQVVHQLGSLITKKSSVFEAAVSLHGSNLVAQLKAVLPLVPIPFSRIYWHL